MMRKRKLCRVAMAQKVTPQSIIASDWPPIWNRWSSLRGFSAIAELLVVNWARGRGIGLQWWVLDLQSKDCDLLHLSTVLLSKASVCMFVMQCRVSLVKCIVAVSSRLVWRWLWRPVVKTSVTKWSWRFYRKDILCSSTITQTLSSLSALQPYDILLWLSWSLYQVFTTFLSVFCTSLI